MSLDDQQLAIEAEQLSIFTPRQRAIFKLRFGGSPLTPLEQEKILSEYRSLVVADRSHTLEEIANYYGRSRERIRQIESALLERLGVHRLDISEKIVEELTKESI